MTSSPSGGTGRNPVEALAEEFLDRRRRGERPSLDDYCRDHPGLAGEIRDLFPLLVRVDDLGADTLEADTSGPAAARAPALERLGDFRILREVGRGGMGIVYEAEQESLGRRVALKVLSDAALANTRHVLRFEREAKAAARLHHTNIVPVFGVGRDGDRHFYVMQFIPGMGLDAVIDELRRLRADARGDGPPAVPPAPCGAVGASEVARAILTGSYAFSLAGTGPAAGADGSGTSAAPAADRSDPSRSAPRDPAGSSGKLPGISDDSLTRTGADRLFFRSVARIGRQVAEALEYAHGQGVLHRDIKPANLLLDPRGNVWVADFGLAKATDQADVTEAGDLLGTLRYMAPERFAGRCDARSDVYALGLTLYELLALRPAFDAPDRQALVRRVIDEAPEPLRQSVPHLPRDLGTIVAKAIAREPAARYPTAAALAEDLQSFLEDRPIQARRAGATEQAWRWARRNPVVACLAALAAALLVVVATVTSVGYVRVTAALNAANRSLYHSLVGEARALRLARVNGYREHAVSRLRRALRIGTPDRDVDVLRHEAVACLGDFVGFAPRAFPRLPAQATAIAVHPHDDRMVLGLIDGTLLLCRRTNGVEIARLRGHPGEIASLAFGPDGKLLVSGDRKGTIKVWDRTDGDDWRCRKTLAAAFESAYQRVTLPVAWWVSGSLVVTPDGKLLAACSSEGKVAMWNLADPDLAPAPGLAAGGPQQALLCLALSPDGRFMAAAYHEPQGKHGAIVWDVATRRIVRSMPTLGFNRLAFSPDSRWLACGSGAGHFLLDARTLQPQRPFLVRDGVDSVAFSPDGQLLAVATIFGKVSLWSVATDDEIATLDHPDSTGGILGRRLEIAFSPDGQTLLAVSGRTALSWGLDSAGERRVLYGPRSIVEGLSFSRDGRFLAIAHGGVDDTGGTLTLRDASTGRILCAPVPLPGARWAEISPDSTVLATCSNSGRLEFRGLPSLEELTRPIVAGPVLNCVAFSPDGQVLAACGDAGLSIWRLGRDGPGREAGPGPAPELMRQLPGRASYLCFSQDGKRIAWADGFRRVKLWDLKRECEVPFRGPNLLAGWQCFAFLPDGRHLAMIADSRAAEVWDVDTGRKAFALGEAGEFAKSQVALSPDGRWLAGDHTTSSVAVWDVARRRRLFVLPDEHGPIAHLTWRPDGKCLAVGMKDGRVILWDLPQIRAELAALGLDW
jgi:WD40 repeat protein